ncbi:HAMP domain-containing sensor histidine kinase [soil metagenome]
MKLLNKTSIYYLLFAVPVFALCSIFLYVYVSAQIRDNVDEALWKDRLKVEQKLQAGKSIDSFDDEIKLIPTEKDAIDGELVAFLSDTLIYDKYEEEFLPYRIQKSVVNSGKLHYLLTIKKSTIEADDLIESIIYPILLLFVVLLFGFFFINWYISKKLWSPFYKTINQLNSFKISETPIKYEKSAIKEFSELNSVLTNMTEQMYQDFISQKQFIENASHEIQTPLAVIKTKIELLIQSSTLSEKDMQLIQSVYNASNKLSSLNKALLLLSKIENNQFIDLENIYFKSLIEKNIEHFEDLISIKNIKIEKDYSATPIHQMNPILADILITNLIQNAIRHNIKDGFIKIELAEKFIRLSNSSIADISDTNELFKRFKKSDESNDSIGLGLAIVKEICESFDIKLQYQSENNTHSLTLSF